ncbi:MAG: hypothetical protein Q9163_006363, partial [Psora crenata]
MYSISSLLVALSALAATTLAADCSQKIPDGGPSPSDVANFLTPLIPQICHPQAGGISTTPQNGFVFYVGSPNGPLDTDKCSGGFQDIIDQCVTQGDGCPGGGHCYGGQWVLNDQLLNITMFATDGTNPIEGAGGAGGAGGDGGG